MMIAYAGYSEFRNAAITCPKCAWSGQGRQAEVGEMFEGGTVSEYHCPQCGEYIAVAPSTKAVRSAPRQSTGLT
jgi:predicted RNA-binding Zn-ribbon protein involved in translation (DUF1610 family)